MIVYRNWDFPVIGGPRWVMTLPQVRDNITYRTTTHAKVWDGTTWRDTTRRALPVALFVRIQALKLGIGYTFLLSLSIHPDILKDGLELPDGFVRAQAKHYYKTIHMYTSKLGVVSVDTSSLDWTTDTGTAGFSGLVGEAEDFLGTDLYVSYETSDGIMTPVIVRAIPMIGEGELVQRHWVAFRERTDGHYFY